VWEEVGGLKRKVPFFMFCSKQKKGCQKLGFLSLLKLSLHNQLKQKHPKM
jgi:hypothetical protein